MKDSILVTIITVAYNSEATIKRTIESVLAQTYPDIEYLIIDGGSTDNTVKIAGEFRSSFAEADGKSMTIISEPDNGMYDALNKGVRLAKGRLIGNINADDWYEPRAVEDMVSFYENEHFDLAWADLVIHKKSGDFVKRAKVGKLWTTAHFCHPTMFGTKECEMKFPYAVLQMDDDFDMVLRANKAGAKIMALNKVLAHYTFGGMSTQRSLKKMNSRIWMKYRTYVRNGYSRFYWFYCVAVEFAKFVLGGE
ncbi:Glycosyl transferase family 2 [Butyrivibrio hungatei]|uniref:Glycosyl transferase family 2 n=1 Tax=Butyrivibrio hungatei TaxID=185008 RepID=A0A1G5E283_9FIRM|nr:glycosyltransferase family 2 protein [Butyrivibrio hungatei]SCY21102.1 Glycosyl transferase family 2 [Butyrivibrio hungatei]